MGKHPLVKTQELMLPLPNTGFSGHGGKNSRIPPSQANPTFGWKVGDDIKNRTIFGTVPKWSTIRRRHWKNRAEWAKNNPGQHKYSEENIARMKEGLAPQRRTLQGEMESMELHHDPSQSDGGLFDFVEVWPEEHAGLDAQRKLGR